VSGLSPPLLIDKSRNWCQQRNVSWSRLRDTAYGTVKGMKKLKRSSEGVVTRLRDGQSMNPGSIPDSGNSFSSPQRPDRLWGPLSGHRGALFSEVKRPVREVAHSPSSSAEVKNAWSRTSTTRYTSIAWCLTEHRDSFTFCILRTDFISETIYRAMRSIMERTCWQDELW
jgi:hypothetical protein